MKNYLNKMVEKIRGEIFEKEKLTCSCGIGPNKMIAKIACEAAKPNGVRVVESKDAEAYVENLNVQKIPGIGRKTAEVLRSSGFNIVADLKKLPKQKMKDLFGARGVDMYQKVRGIDESPVVSGREAKSIGKEVTFEQDTRDPEILVETFERLSQEVAKEVQGQQLSFKTITVVCRFTGFQTHTKSKTIVPTTNAAELKSEATKLLLRFIMEYPKQIRLIGVRFQVVPPEEV